MLRVANQGSRFRPTDRIECSIPLSTRMRPHGLIKRLGLGLFVLKEIVTAHEDKVEVASTESEGARSMDTLLPFNVGPRPDRQFGARERRVICTAGRNG